MAPVPDTVESVSWNSEAPAGEPLITLPKITAGRRLFGSGEETIPLELTQLSTTLLGGCSHATVGGFVMAGAKDVGERSFRSVGSEPTKGMEV